MAPPQVVDVTTGITTTVDSAAVAGTPVPSVKDGNGKIFVSLATYRGTNEIDCYLTACMHCSISQTFSLIH